MRLIDADKSAMALRTSALFYASSDEKDSLVKSELLNEIAEIIDCEEITQTAYDLDKVVEQIKESTFIANKYEEYMPGRFRDEEIEVLDLKEIIKLVQGGRIAE